MAIVKYPEYSVEIVVQEGTGEISNATFSATLDPMSTSSMVLMKKKNTNLKPFIWGVSKWGDSAYNYVPNTYKGISTIGSGNNAVITLTFSQPVDHFTLYFDEVAQSMPLSLTIGANTYTNDDYMFTYSQDIAQTMFTITINEINKINGVEMPLMITGIENRIALDITHRTGLRKLRTGHTYTKDKGKPAYGIISQEGALDIFDFYTEIDDLIEMGLIDNKMDITVKFQDNVVGKYTSDTWTEQQTSLFNVSLNDKLMEWQNIIVPKKYDLELDKNAENLYNYLKSMTDLEFVIDTTTLNHLNAIQIKYYYWEESTLWEFAQKLCDLGQLYIYMRNDGKVVVISQHRINELKAENSSNPIIIPYSRIDGQPKVDRLTNNIIDKVELTSKVYSLEKTKVHNLSLNIYSGEGDSLSNYRDNSQNNSIIPTTSIDGLASNINPNYNLTSNLFYMFNIDKYYGVRNFKNFSVEVIKKYNGQGISEFRQFSRIRDVLIDSTSEYNEVYFYWYNNIEEYLNQWFNKTTNGDLYNYTLKNSSASSFKIGLIENPSSYTVLAIVPKDSTGTTGLSEVTIEAIINIYCSVLTQVDKKIKVGAGENVYKPQTDEFVSNTTIIGLDTIYQYNANQILSNFTGKQTISFRMATDTLNYKKYKYELKNPYDTYHGNADFSTGESGVYDIYLYENYFIEDGVVFVENVVSNFDDIVVGRTYYMGFSNLLTTYEILQKNVSQVFPFLALVDEKKYRTEDMKTLIACDYNKGETLKELDLIQLKKTDGTYDPKIWQISKVEHEVGGSNWLNIEAVEI